MADVGGRRPRTLAALPSFNQFDFIEAAMRTLATQASANLDYAVLNGGSAEVSVDSDCRGTGSP